MIKGICRRKLKPHLWMTEELGIASECKQGRGLKTLWFFPFDKAAPIVLLAGYTSGIAFKNKVTAILALLDFCE